MNKSFHIKIGKKRTLTFQFLNYNMKTYITFLNFDCVVEKYGHMIFQLELTILNQTFRFEISGEYREEK